MNFLKKLFGDKPSNPPIQNANKKALCIGINDYPGTQNDLRGCVNDCMGWATILQTKFGFSNVKTLTNSQATIQAVKQEMTNLVVGSKDGDVLVITYSGHGSTVADANNDEADGKDETLYLYNGNLIDDEIKDILQKLPKGVRLTIVSDSCHSGTVTRAVLAGLNGKDVIKPRFMPPVDGMDSLMLAKRKTKKKAFLGEDMMNEVLISGCQSFEYSYDANMGGKPMGAMSYCAIELLNSRQDYTYDSFYLELRKKLPNSRYPQTPQLEGTPENRNRLIFT